jgi:type I pantothenate kinase
VLGGGGQEASVAAGGVEHADALARLDRWHRRLDETADELGRGGKGAPLAPPTASLGGARRRLRHGHSSSVWSVAMSSAESRYITIDRDAWAALRAATPLTLRQEDLDKLRGINEQIELDEVAAVYLPLSRLLNLRVSASQDLARVSSTFLGAMAPRVPYVIGVAGSVAVGKSTFARILQALLSRWPDHPDVDLVTTDGFLHPNAVLEERGLMARKGFPESYDTRRLLAFLRDVKSGAAEVRAPVYSHVIYDVLPDEETIVGQPDILILEGLNVLQVSSSATEFVSDYFDFSIYIDAAEADILDWFIARFMALRESVFKDPNSFFRHFAALSDDEARRIATEIWHDINGRNLRENILPTRERASLILRKGGDHRVTSVRLHKL